MSESKRNPPSFEERANSLEEVVRELEGGDLPRGLSATLFEQGVELGRELSERLDEAQREVEELISRDPDAQVSRPPHEPYRS